METTRRGYMVVVVAETDKLDQMTRAAIEKLGTKLRSAHA